MESEGMNLLRNSTVLLSAFVGACVLLLVYILKQLNAEPKSVEESKNEKQTEQAEKKKESATSKGKKKGAEGRWSSRSDKQAYSHPWLLTSLKGHTGQVQDMDFASNGKYLASCAEEDLDPDPGGDLGLDRESTSSNNSDSNRESSAPSSATPSPRTKGLSRRQRKNRRREDHSPTEIKKKAKAKRPEACPSSNAKIATYTPSKYYVKLKQLNLPEYRWPQCMTRYVLRSEEMMPIGYPVFSKLHQGRAVIFKSFMAIPTFSQSRYTKINVTESKFDVNAQEFVPGMDYSEIKAEWNANHDSGQGSGCSSDSGEVDSEENSTSSDGDLVPLSNQKFPDSGSQDELCDRKNVNNSCDSNLLYDGAEERACSRCSQAFYTTNDGKYISQDSCYYHWGKLHNGKHKSYSLAPREYTCCKDRTVLLWDVKDLMHRDHKSLRINVEFDYPTFVKWSPDSKAFIIHKYNANCIEVYKVEKKKDGWIGPATKAITFPKVHEEDVVGLGIACNGKFIMTCSNKTDLVVWDLRGQELARVDTYLMNTVCAKISPCGRFIVASGFAPHVAVWEVIFNKTGEFQEVKRAFELTGHTSGVYDVALDADTSHMATVSKDGTWKLFDTKIEYKKGEDPHLKITGKSEQSGNALIALSPKSDVVAIATSNSVALYSTRTGSLDTSIENIFEGHIVSMMFDAVGKYLLVAGDKHIRVFHNVTGYRCDIAAAQEKLKQHQTSATKERLEKLICDSEAFLNRLGEKL